MHMLPSATSGFSSGRITSSLWIGASSVSYTHLDVYKRQHLYAPYGLDELYCGILRPNPLMDHRELFRQKAASYRDRWHWLQIRED